MVLPYEIIGVEQGCLEVSSGRSAQNPQGQDMSRQRRERKHSGRLWKPVYVSFVL